ncbi:YceI family protein [Acidocella sp.]|uniref:YceI family protein n=1 Tax=Acidocella sp. TaxID=50710 RepID=UPI0026019A72|nr:YceI family protein [Acidocella sp.]MDD2794967.1 YceI family protein [Acidocella sp.]
MNIKTLALGAAILAAPALAHAQNIPPLNTNPAAVPAATYTVEPTHTRVLFAVSHMGFTTWYGQFTNVSGTLNLNPKALSSSSFDITIPANTISTSNTKLDGELNSPEWFNTAKYPIIEFKSEKIVRTGRDTAKVTGELTFHGVTRPETLDVTFNASGVNILSKQYTVGFNATGHIKRSDFNQKTYIPLIGDDVTLIISVAFVK